MSTTFFMNFLSIWLQLLEAAFRLVPHYLNRKLHYSCVVQMSVELSAVLWQKRKIELVRGVNRAF